MSGRNSKGLDEHHIRAEKILRKCLCESVQAMIWSDGIDFRDYANALREYEAEKK